MRIGIDSYSYHRLFGEVRRGEEPVEARWQPEAVLAHARELKVAGVSLETCFLPLPDSPELAALGAQAGPLELVLAWGHPHGFEFGASGAALGELTRWLERGAALGCTLVRCVAASPAFRGAAPIKVQLAATVKPLSAAASVARSLGLTLAVENHGDLRAAELLELVERVDGGLGVCLDTANAVRVGDDPLEAAALLAPLTRMVHLKDIESPIGILDPVAGPCSVPYGEGVVPVAEILAVLDAAGFDGLVCVELGQLSPGTDELELIASSVAWLARYLPAASNGPSSKGPSSNG